MTTDFFGFHPHSNATHSAETNQNYRCLMNPQI